MFTAILTSEITTVLRLCNQYSVWKRKYIETNGWAQRNTQQQQLSNMAWFWTVQFNPLILSSDFNKCKTDSKIRSGKKCFLKKAALHTKKLFNISQHLNYITWHTTFSLYTSQTGRQNICNNRILLVLYCASAQCPAAATHLEAVAHNVLRGVRVVCC